MKPVGDTLEKMKENIGYDDDMHTFLKDQEIEDAYQTLKPVFDYLHEKFINDSLEDKNTKEIDFSKYFDKYEVKKLQKLSAKDFKPIEDSLRSSFDTSYRNVAETWKKDAGKNKKNKDILKKDGFKILTENGVLDYIEKNIEEYSEIVGKEKIQEALNRFRGFFTYFSGFNQNRENYYETKKEAATAVATRIVNENLPKFCDNILFFRDRKNEYLNTYDSLKANEKVLITKDKKELFPVSKNIFSISHFSNCLSQKEIEKYNDEIGNANFLINLYNQQNSKDKAFKKLPLFKTLYKQIGCGKSESLFFTITDDRKEDAKEHKNIKNPVSLEEVLKMVNLFAKKIFNEQAGEIGVKSVPAFERYLLGRENYDGVYWSKAAINTISSRYFANWHDLQDKLIEKKVFEKSKKGGEDKINIPDAIELSRLFDVIDETEGWQERLYKDSILKDESKKNIIDNAESAPLSLLRLIFADIDKDIKSFFDKSDEVLNLKDYSEKENKELIKKWLDDALSVTQILRYFSVRENKAKSNSLDSTITEALKFMLQDAELEIEIAGRVKEERADWFKWYDAVRNYLTKKPQDEMKDNKLKLNFVTNNGSLLNGFVDSCTEKSDNGTQYGGYLFRKKSDENLDGYEYFLGISKDSKLFRCSQKDSVVREDKSDLQRLEYYQPKSTTFFSEEYSKNKERIIDLISNKVKKIIEEKKILLTSAKDERSLGNKGKQLLKGTTPTKLIDNIYKEDKHSDFLGILKDKELVDLIKSTIGEMKNFVKQYEKRTPALKEIQSKNYEEALGLKKIIDDLQHIAKITKIYDYFPISDKELEVTCNRKENPLYLFKISNKDLSKRVKTKENDIQKKFHKNLHSLYFETLFSGNQETIDIGKGEVFYRKKAINKKEIKKGYENKDWIIKDKRFTENESLEKNNKTSATDGKSFFLHLSIILNYTKPSLISGGFNKEMNKEIKQYKDQLYFLGIDRGEKHLAYYSLVDSDGNILKQGSLNLPFLDKEGKQRIIKAEKRTIDQETGKEKVEVVDCKNYNDLLEARAGDRDYARKNWQTIGTIKELKDGYISQVVRQIVDIATKNDKFTFIVLEDLNIGFKRGRQKIEKSVYQKLELALAKKLNFLVDKEAEDGKIGSVTKAIQLTPPVNTFSDMENWKQFGNMLYIRADYTSQTDPVTGWRKSIYLKSGSEKNIKDQIRSSFSDIGYEHGDYYFEYKDVHGTIWKLYSGKDGISLDRFYGERNNNNNTWEPTKQDTKKMLDILFTNFNKEKSYYEQLFEEGIELVQLPKEINKKNKPAWESLRFAINLIQQIRNTGESEKDNDFILSPIRDNSGNHFDSRKAKNNQPTNGDANGAYNIARKGIIASEHIKRNLDKLYIRDEEWGAWLAGKKTWEKWLEDNKGNLVKTKK